LLGSSTHQGSLETKVSFHTEGEHLGLGHFAGKQHTHQPSAELDRVVEPSPHPVAARDNIAHH
jgi:hypothetical protein